MVGNDRETYKLLSKSDSFTLNYFEFKHIKEIRKWGRSSGREINKIKEFNIKCDKATKVKGLILKDAYLSLECKKVKKIKLGDHTLFIGKVVLIRLKGEALGKDNTLSNRIKPILYLGIDSYSTTSKKVSLRSLPFHYKNPTKRSPC